MILARVAGGDLEALIRSDEALLGAISGATQALGTALRGAPAASRSPAEIAAPQAPPGAAA
eukprot:1188467-Heterocapsa_arctica.AAC.1